MNISSISYNNAYSHDKMVTNNTKMSMNHIFVLKFQCSWEKYYFYKVTIPGKTTKFMNIQKRTE